VRNVSYTLLSVPLYLAGQLDRLFHEYLCRREGVHEAR